MCLCICKEVTNQMLYLCFIVGYDHELYVRQSICVVEICRMGLNNFVEFRLLAELKMWF